MNTPVDAVDEDQDDYETRHAERLYRARRERFAVAAFRALIAKEELSKRTDWKEIARVAVAAADELEEALNPTPVGLPPYEPG